MKSEGNVAESFEFTREVVINAEPETIFPYLTEESKMKEWFGEIVEADAQPGGVFHIGTFDGMHCRGEYVEIKPYEKVVFTWGGVADLNPGESTVEITLKFENSVTKLTLRHFNIPHQKGADSFGEGWKTRAFPLLKDISEGKKLKSFCFESGSECGVDKN
jgi:uncharacterized protein YndB with AHSA1/START domain